MPTCETDNSLDPEYICRQLVDDFIGLAEDFTGLVNLEPGVTGAEQ